jgi:lon-related putative ATP-dependent protease
MTTGPGRSDIAERLRVPVERLTTSIDETKLGFSTTKEVAPLEVTIGQDRALKALQFGLEVDAGGFNIYVAGMPGTGRNTTLGTYLRNLAVSRPVPNDWLYVYNFANPLRPRGISLPPGMGRQLASDMAELLSEVRLRVPPAFEGGEYQRRVDVALEDIHARHRGLTEELVEEAKKRGVVLALTEAGVAATPLGADGEPLTPEQISKFTPEESERLREQQSGLQEFIGERVSVLRQMEREAQRARQQVNREIGDFVVSALFTELRETYDQQGEVLDYLDEVREDMVTNVLNFIQGDRPSAPPPFQEMLAGPSHADDEMVRYEVNVYVDHSRSHGAPVVFEQSPTYHNVFGRIRHSVRQGVMNTDFTMMSSGCIHSANGGFLVFQVKDLLTYPFVWQTLKQVLQSGQVRAETVPEQISMNPTTSLEPEPVPLDLKIILVGNPSLARMLMLYDEDFYKLFKVKADFGYELELTDENIAKHAQFVVNRVQEQGLPHFEASAVARLVEHSSRLAENQNKLTARFVDIADLVTEAAFCAGQAGHELVNGEDVLRAVQEHRERSNLVEERLQELYDDGTIRLEVEGEAVGQINGLAVIDMGDYSFGRPSRLTARVGLGRGEFGNVEQAAQMSGRIHSKGFQILIGYLMGKYGVDAMMPVRVSIAFEQTYEEIDGDSAASTELYALLSALSGAPIHQGFAVTGSVDQQGRVQAIGGATRKIEGFYDVCKAKGLTGEQGVMIPVSNVRNLVLRKDVVQAVEAGQFHIYGIATVEEGIELLTGVPAGEADADGAYPDGSVNARVMTVLEAMGEKLRDPDRANSSSRETERPVVIEEPEGRDRDPREGPGAPPTPPSKADR